MQSATERFSKVKRIGTELGWSDNIYHQLIRISWLKFTLLFFASFLTFNFVFAFLYWLLPGGLKGTDGSLFAAFSFSVETFSTVGYGAVTPQSGPAHILMIVQAMLSVLSTALLTGLTFAKFSHPGARIVFTENALINDFDGQRVLMFRMANLRNNQIVEASVRVVGLVTQVSREGEQIRRQIDLPVTRNMSLFFSLTWTVMHIINKESLLYGLTAEQIRDRNIEIAVSVIGYDETLGQTVHSNCIYAASDIVYDRYFEDLIGNLGGRVDSIDYRKFNQFKPVGLRV